MPSLRRIKLTKLNEHLVCPLCKGYFVEATTIIECLHTFCKTCIVNYLKKSSYCPVCEVQVHKAKPISGLREDKTLQDVVYKLVPNLFRCEMERRLHFYKEHPEAGGDRTEQSLKERRHFFHVDDQISLSLEFLPPAHAHAHALGLRPLRAPSLCHAQAPTPPSASGTGEDHDKDEESGGGLKESDKSEEDAADDKNRENKAKEEDKKVRIPLRRYLKCPAAVHVRLLEKFIRLKYNLSPHHRVDIVHGGDCLSPELTLLDVVYMYKWTEDEPLKLQYTVIAPPLPIRRKPRTVLGKARQPVSPRIDVSPKKLVNNISPKKTISITSDKEDSKSPGKRAKMDDDLKMCSSPKRLKVDNEELKSPVKKAMKDDEAAKEAKVNDESSLPKVLEDMMDVNGTEGSSSLNSSRDDADDAMVIDESAVETSTQATDMEVDQTPHVKDVLPDSNNSNEETVKTSSNNSTVTSQESKGPSKEIFCSKPNYVPTASTNSLSVRPKFVPPASNSSIESLKALVNNNSSYSGYSSNQIKSSPNAPLIGPTIGRVNSGSVNLLSPKPAVSQCQINKINTQLVTTENYMTSSRPTTPTVSSIASTHVMGNISCNPGMSTRPASVPGAPLGPKVRLSTPCISSTPNTPVTSPKISTTNVTSSSSKVLLPKVSTIPSTSPSKMKPAVNTTVEKQNSVRATQGGLISLTSAVISTATKTSTLSAASMIPSTKPLASPKTSSIHSSVSTVSMPASNTILKAPQIHSSITPAPTSLTPALKTPLISSSTPSQTASPAHSFTGVPTTLSSLHNKTNPIPSPRLVSNSYRANLQMNGAAPGIRMNGMMSTHRSIIDPTKPRLGRPPNSARIAAAAAGRIGPQHILPRGASPREIYNQQKLTKTESRGRGKSQVANTAGKGSMNRFIAPQKPILPMMPTMPGPKSGSRPQLPLTSSPTTSGAGKELDVNGTNIASGSAHMNGISKLQTSKEPSSKSQPQMSQSISNKLGHEAIPNSTGLVKDVKKPSNETPLSSSPKVDKKNSVSMSPKISSSGSIPSSASPQNRTPVSSGGKQVKSPSRTKSHNGSPASILNIAQSLANKQLQLSQGLTDPALLLGATTAAAPSPVSPPAMAAALGLSSVNPALCAAYELAAFQNYIGMGLNYNNLNLAATAACMNMGIGAHMQQDPKKTPDAAPIDLSPTNKATVNNSQPPAVARPAKGTKASSAVKKTTATSKAAPILSPRSTPSTPCPPASVPSPQPAQSASPGSPSTPATPNSGVTLTKTAEVTITKLPNSSSDTVTSTTPTTSIAPKPTNTNTVSIIKRSSSTSSSSGSFGIARSPSNAMMRQITNPTRIAHQSNQTSTKLASKTTTKQPPQPPPVNNNNNNNNCKPLKMDV